MLDAVLEPTADPSQARDLERAGFGCAWAVAAGSASLPAAAS